jgi:hypothetical protein
MLIHILSADISTAFDAVTPPAVLRAVVFWQVPADLFLAILREFTGLKAKANVAGAETEVFDFGRRKQGGPESTILFNTIVRALFATVVDKVHIGVRPANFVP